MTLTGVAGRLFSPLALAYIAAIVASLGVALTVTPALCCILLAHRPIKKSESRLTEWLTHHYRRWLAYVQHHGRTVAAIVVPLCVGALAALLFFNSQFLPSLHEGHYIVHMQLAPGASLQAGLRLGRRVSAALRKIPGVRSVALRMGRAELISDPVPSYAGEIGVDLKSLSGVVQARVLKQINATLAGFRRRQLLR